MTLARLAAIGHDLVITSAHYGARPSHAEWQGRPCCVSGPKLVGGVQYPGLVQLTGYGGVGGLKGVNCRHSIGPYYPGVTDLPDLSFPRESGHFGMTSEECYEAMQRQRELERRVRGTKREIAAMEQAGIGLETPRYAQKRLLLGRQQQALRKHCEESGLVRNYPREKAYGVGAQPRALRAAAKAKAAGRYRHPASQERIDALTSGALAGVRFSAPPTYNGRIRTPGLTKVGYDGDGRKYAGPVYIGKQAKPGDAELVDTILHLSLIHIFVDRVVVPRVPAVVVVPALFDPRADVVAVGEVLLAAMVADPDRVAHAAVELEVDAGRAVGVVAVHGEALGQEPIGQAVRERLEVAAAHAPSTSSITAAQ